MSDLRNAIPVLFVRDVTHSASFYRDRLGFKVDFLHGNPPFYASVSRAGATLHLRFVHESVFDAAARAREEGLIDAFVPVEDIAALYAEFQSAVVPISQPLTKQPWGGTDFHIRDPDGNVIGFANLAAGPAPAEA